MYKYERRGNNRYIFKLIVPITLLVTYPSVLVTYPSVLGTRSVDRDGIDLHTRTRSGKGKSPEPKG